jgi:hypothetical protein
MYVSHHQFVWRRCGTSESLRGLFAPQLDEVFGILHDALSFFFANDAYMFPIGIWLLPPHLTTLIDKNLASRVFNLVRHFVPHGTQTDLAKEIEMEKNEIGIRDQKRNGSFAITRTTWAKEVKHAAEQSAQRNVLAPPEGWTPLREFDLEEDVLRLQEVIKEIRICEKIGSGGYGDVFLYATFRFGYYRLILTALSCFRGSDGYVLKFSDVYAMDPAVFVGSGCSENMASHFPPGMGVTLVGQQFVGRWWIVRHSLT